MKKWWLVAFFCLWTARIVAAEGAANEGEWLNEALQNDPSHLEAQSQEQWLRYKQQQYLRDLFPKISISYEDTKGKIANDYVGQSYAVEVKQPLFEGFRLKNTVLKSRLEHQASEYAIEKEKMEFYINAYTLLYECNQLKMLLDAVQILQERASAWRDIMQEKLTAGTVPEIDSLDVQDYYEQIVRQSVELQHDYQLAQLKLQQQINPLPPLEELSLLDEEQETALLSQELNLDDLLHAMEQTNPEIRQSQLKLEAAVMQEKISQGAFWPSINLEGHFGESDEKNERRDLDLSKDWAILLSVSVPLGTSTLNNETSKTVAPTDITGTESVLKQVNKTSLGLLDNMQSQSDKLEAKWKERQEYREWKETRDRYIFQLNKTYLEWKRYQEMVGHYKQQNDIQVKRMKILGYQAERNEESIKDVLQAILKMIEVKRNYWNARYQCQLALKTLNLLTGISQ